MTSPINDVIAAHMDKIASALPDDYKLTAFFRHTSGSDASVVLSNDDLPTAIALLSEKVGLRP